jgi:hypothetical protein
MPLTVCGLAPTCTLNHATLDHDSYFNCTSSADAGGTFEDVCVKRTKRLSIERRDILKPIARVSFPKI